MNQNIVLPALPLHFMLVRKLFNNTVTTDKVVQRHLRFSGRWRVKPEDRDLNERTGYGELLWVGELTSMFQRRKSFKLSLCLAKYHAMKMYWGVEV